jgi:PleD family two-component response regulator
MISEPLLHHEMKILIIDDQRVSVLTLKDLLERNGYRHVLGITDSSKAIEIFNSFGPDLVLLDLIMPDTDGFAVLETLRSSEAPESFLPIVVLTADVSEGSKVRALEAGATDFLVKPVSPAEALLRIRNLLETRRLHVILENQRSALEEALRARTATLRAVNPRLTEPLTADLPGFA